LFLAILLTKKDTMRLVRHLWVSVLVITSCQPEQETQTKTLDFARFTIEVPSSWQAVTRTGFDSYVGGIQAGGLGDIEFDLGRFASALDVDPNTHEVYWTTIDGRKAKIVKPRGTAKGITGIYFESLEEFGGLKFQMSSRNARPSVRDQMLKAFESITFRSPDEIPPFVPDCVRELIETIRSKPVHDPPARVWQFEYGGSVVYYATEPGDVYSEDCTFICRPDGGSKEIEDDDCTLSLERGILLWQDGR
jgi:hypothetical protein